MREALIISVIVVAVVALVALAAILIYVFRLKHKIQKEDELLRKKELISEGHKRVVERKDFMEIDYKSKDLFNNSFLNDESIEFCINNIIKNNFQNILIFSEDNGFESLSIINKTEANFYINNLNQKNNFMNNVDNHFSNLTERIKIHNNEQNLDLIILLDKHKLKENFLLLFSLLETQKMFIIPNIKKNKEKKEMYKFLLKNKYRFESLNWSEGFFLIIKE